MNIFFESRKLELIDFDASLILGFDGRQTVDCESEKCLIRNFFHSTSGDESVVVANPEAMAQAVSFFFRIVHAAGGVVYSNGHMLSIVRNSVPDLPKGHVEDGETLEETALREVAEETGQEGLKVMRRLPDTWHCYLLDEQPVLKRTAWFLMTTSVPFALKPQTEEGITQVKLVDNNTIQAFVDNTFRSISENIGDCLLSLFAK